MAIKYVVIEVLEREIGAPRVYGTFKEAIEDMCTSLAQVKGYNTWEDFTEDYPEAKTDDYYGDNWGIYKEMAYAETANHDNWDIEIFTLEV